MTQNFPGTPISNLVTIDKPQFLIEEFLVEDLKFVAQVCFIVNQFMPFD